MQIHEYLPPDWIEFQQQLIHKRPDIWRTVNRLDYVEAVAYLNSLFGTNVRTDETYGVAGKIFLNALLKKEGILILSNGEYSR